MALRARGHRRGGERSERRDPCGGGRGHVAIFEPISKFASKDRREAGTREHAGKTTSRGAPAVLICAAHGGGLSLINSHSGSRSGGERHSIRMHARAM